MWRSEKGSKCEGRDEKASYFDCSTKTRMANQQMNSSSHYRSLRPTPSRTMQSTAVKSFKLFVGLCMHRPAIVSAKMTDLESRVSSLLSSVELEKSHLSLHELRARQDEKRESVTSKQKTFSNPNLLLTAKEQELQWKNEASNFTFASRSTESDAGEKLRSRYKLLDRNLILLTKQSVSGETATWGLPFQELDPRFNLKQAAVNMLTTHFPDEVNCKIIGQAPAAVHVYKFADPSSSPGSKKQGVQIYFFNCHTDPTRQETIVKLPGVTDHAWVPIESIGKFVSDPSLAKVLNSFIFDY